MLNLKPLTTSKLKEKSENKFSLNEFVSARCLPQTLIMRKKQRRNEEKHDRTMQRIYLPCRGNNLPDWGQVQSSHIVASDEQYPALQRTAYLSEAQNGKEN